MKKNKEYKSVAEIYSRYWRIYGGSHALLRSPYLHSAVLISIILFPIWTNENWWEIPLSIMPNILGFSLSGLAIFMAIGDNGFKSIIAGSEEDKASPFMNFCSTFVHFIILQILSILFGLLTLSLSQTKIKDLCLFPIISGVSFLVFSYALLTALAATMALFRMSSSYDKYHEKKNK
ncbi:hypothetical protein [Vreelandella stevensii]|uniref:hypothetical protein n=1 Tax=Vreelandella stevensii TaxID=502821 RepID=UPI00403ABC0B